MLLRVFIITGLLCILVCGKRAGGRAGSSGRSYGSYSSHSSAGSSSHNSQSTGGRHAYPESGGLSGNNAGNQNSRASGAHSYPESGGLSGNSNKNSQNIGRNGPSNTYQKTEVHYHYNPPQQINYGSSYHPVYHGQPPVYVYEYRNSGSRFDTLLTGLALYNLGRMSGSHHGYHRNERDYSSTSGEICKLGVSKTNGEYEETRIDCKLMSSFIWDAERDSHNTMSTLVTTTVNVTRISNYNTGETVITQNSTSVSNALDVKGPSIPITNGMSCFMIRISRDGSVLKRKVECGLLQEYATRSYHASSFRSTGEIKTTILCFVLATVIM